MIDSEMVRNGCVSWDTSPDYGDVADELNTPFASREKLEEKLVKMGWIFDSEDWQGDKTVTKRKRFTKRHGPDEIRELFTGSYGVAIDDAIPYSALSPAFFNSLFGDVR